MSYYVGVDLGTTYSGMAVSRPGTGTAEAVTLGAKSSVVASAVFSGEDGAFLVGEAAERRALSDPDQVVREFKRRIGDATPVLVGRRPYAAEELAARFIAHMLRDVSAREGGPPDGVAVTHPAGWGPHKVQSLRSALAGQGVGPLLMLTEPQAAAVGYASAERVEPGAVVAVYDLGGGTFDAAVVRKGKGEAGGFELLGRPEGLERLGGVDFDEVVFEHVQQALGPAWDELDPTDPAVLAAVARLRRECTAAKEVLSVDTEVHVPVMLPGVHTSVRLGRAEFEEMIRPAVLQTVDAMREAMASAHVTPADLTALLLVGGSSRIPLVAQLVSAGIGRPPAVDVDPKGVIAAGAAVVARDAAARPAAVPAPVVAPVPGESPVESTMPGAPVPEPAGAEQDGRAIEGDRTVWVPTEEALARPPKVARPFSAGLPEPGRKRVLVLAVAAGVLVAALAGTAVALGATGIGRNTEAGAETPIVTTTVQVPDPPAPAPQQQQQQQQPAPRRAPANPQQPAQQQEPPVVVTTEPAPTTTEAPPTTEPTTDPPTTTPTTTTPPVIDPGDGTGGGTGGGTEEEGAAPAGGPGGAEANPEAPAGGIDS